MGITALGHAIGCIPSARRRLRWGNYENGAAEREKSLRNPFGRRGDPSRLARWGRFAR
jgi:hypothetical protein